MSLLRRLFGDGESPSHAEAAGLARSGDPQVRRRLGARADTAPELLYYLADDPDAAVRREIAANGVTPAQANLMLAMDGDEGVRSGLAAKLARLAPGLSAEEQDRLRRMTYESLLLLARDQALRVRQILAEALKDMAEVPPGVIRRLAHDAELAVSAPVLEFSPVLTDQDLLEIIASQPASGALVAISRRETVGPAVSDAIVANDDPAAIAALLGNASAQIREATLDCLIERAPQHESWHAPLVHRPNLPRRAAARLAHFVADHLVQALLDRRDIDEETASAVAMAVRKRLDEPGPPSVRGGKAKPPRERPLEVARQLMRRGMLDEVMVASALASNDRDFVMAALALRSELPLELVQKVVVTQSARAMVALAWRAKLPMALAVQLQLRLARIPPADVVCPVAGDYPMDAAEMEWQLDFFSTLSEKGA